MFEGTELLGMGYKDDDRFDAFWGKSASGRGHSLSKGSWVGVYSKSTREARNPHIKVD